MNDIINDVNDLKENILKSSEYLNFKKSEKNLDNNKEVNKIITDIKKLQQKILRLKLYQTKFKIQFNKQQQNLKRE